MKDLNIGCQIKGNFVEKNPKEIRYQPNGGKVWFWRPNKVGRKWELYPGPRDSPPKPQGKFKPWGENLNKLRFYLYTRIKLLERNLAKVSQLFGGDPGIQMVKLRAPSRKNRPFVRAPNKCGF